MKDFKIYLSLASILLIIYLMAQYNKPTPVNWSPTLNDNDKIPFGTFIIYHQLNDLFPASKVIKTGTSIYTTLNDSTIAAGNYLVIAKSVTVYKDDFTAMLKYIKAGNSVFISSFAFKGFLKDTLKINTSYEYEKGNTRLNFTSDHLKQPIDYTFSKDISNQYFSEFDTVKAKAISKNNFGHTTILNFKFGKGNLYLSLNPLLFSNYSLLTTGGADYAAKALSYMPVTKTVYWDEYQNGGVLDDDSPLRIFFTHPSLQWAYYLSLFGIFIFILFEMKRRQRIIPVIEPLKNSTLDFVNVVGQVYYEKRNNANIAHKKILYLLENLRDEYQLKTNKLDGEFIEKLTAKLSLQSDFVNDLVNYIRYISTQERVTDSELIELNKLIDQLYIQAR